MLHNLCRNDSSKCVLVCSRGGGGLLEKRMELVSELWENDIKVCSYNYNFFSFFLTTKSSNDICDCVFFNQAEFVPIVDPSPKEQYDYAKEHDIKCLIEMSEGSVKVILSRRYLFP